MTPKEITLAFFLILALVGFIMVLIGVREQSKKQNPKLSIKDIEKYYDPDDLIANQFLEEFKYTLKTYGMFSSINDWVLLNHRYIYNWFRKGRITINQEYIDSNESFIKLNRHFKEITLEAQEEIKRLNNLLDGKIKEIETLEWTINNRDFS